MDSANYIEKLDSVALRLGILKQGLLRKAAAGHVISVHWEIQEENRIKKKRF